MSFKQDLINLRPQHLIIFSFASIILVGTALLMMPFASVQGSMSMVNALFMATSAVCVTGLVVVDMARDLTLWGQTIIICLVQIGGLGILTFSVLFFMMLGKQPSFRSKSSAARFSLRIDTGSIKRILKFVVLMTLFFEGIGAAFLFLSFREIHPLPMAIHSAVFHSISAFCNSGFSIYSDSMMSFNQRPLIPLVIMALIIIGGLGFTVVDELLSRMARDPNEPRRHLSFHAKMALIGTALLIVIGACVFWLLESQNTLRGQPFHTQIVNSLFMAVTPRTAGFNTVSVANMSDSSLFFTILLMFIGGSPGSTAGGIKVNTFIVLMALIIAKIRGWQSTSLFKRKISDLIIDKSLAVFAAFFLTITTAIFLLLMTETYLGNWHLNQHDFFLKIVFEVVSAIGTVGLSTGITPLLSTAGKIIIVMLMFAGRIGPLTLVIGLQSRRKKHVNFEYAEEEVMVG